MLLFSALVAGSFALGARVANDIDPTALTAARFLLAAALMGALARATGGIPRSALAAPWRYGVLGGLFALYFVLMFEGLKTAPPVSAAAVFTLMPILAAVFGVLLLRQTVTPRMAAALAIGGAGALWVIFRGDPAALVGLDLGRGEAIYLAGCVAYGLYTPLLRRLSRGESHVVSAFFILLAGAGLLIVLGWPQIAATDWTALPARVWVTLAYIAVLASAASVMLVRVAALRLPAAKVMAYTYLTPSWVICWELALGGAVPPPAAAVGVGLTVLALLLLLRREDGPERSALAGRS